MSNTALWNIGLLDTHLDLFHTDIPSKYFVCLHNVFKTSWRDVFNPSSRHLQGMFSRRLFETSPRQVLKTSWRRLQRNNFLSSKRSSRRLARRKIVTLKRRWRNLQGMSWRLLGDVFKTNKCLLGSFLISWWFVKQIKFVLGHDSKHW